MAVNNAMCLHCSIVMQAASFKAILISLTNTTSAAAAAAAAAGSRVCLVKKYILERSRSDERLEPHGLAARTGQCIVGNLTNYFIAH